MNRSRTAAENEVLHATPWRGFPWLVHGFTLRRLGRTEDLNLNFNVTEDEKAVARNRRRLLDKLDARGLRLITLRQRHTDIIRVLEGPLPEGNIEADGTLRLAGDALLTNHPGFLLAVQVADCVPILLLDRKRRVVAAVHAGWRGTLAAIAEKAVGRMRLNFGSQPADILAALGPSIRRCCYEVGREVTEAFQGRFPYAEEIFTRTKASPSQIHWQQRLFSEPGEPRPRPALTAPPDERFHLDLIAANARQLQSAGVRKRNIWVSPLCTSCRTDLLFSHRAEHGRTGRMMGLIGWKEAPG